MKRLAILIIVLICCGGAQAQQVKILFDATKAEAAGNADWVIDADTHNLGYSTGPAIVGGGNESNPQRVPTPAQSAITSSTAETYWEGALSAWGVDCVKQGYYVETLPYNGSITYNNSSNTQDLSNYKIFVIDEPNIRFTQTEKNALLQFVYNGGGLFIISDHTVSDRNNDGWDSPAIWDDFFDSVSPTSPFGFRFDLANISPNPTGIVPTPGDSIMDGPYGSVTEMLYSNGTTMTLYPNINPTAQGKIYTTATGTGNTNVLFAIAHYGLGKVAAMGDSSPADDGTGDPNDQLYNGWTQDAAGNHERVIMNATIWLAATATPTPPIVQVSGDSSICHGQSTTLHANGANTYTWQPGALTGDSITVSPTVTTTYYVTGTTNSLSDTDSITVVVTQLPVASFSANVSGDSVTVTNSSTNQTTCTWYWGDNTTYSGCTPPLHIYSPGTYSIKLKVSNLCGTDSVSHSVTINPVVINLQVSGNTNICHGQSSTLHASGATTYTWQPGALTGDSITVSPTVTTTYYVTGTTNGLSDTDSITVVVTQLPVASFSANVSGDSVTVTNSSTNQTTCTWYWGDSTTYSGCTPPLHIYSPGTYSIKLKVSNLCGTDSVSHSVTINPVVINLQVSGNINICHGQSTTLHASGATTYTWQPGALTGDSITVSPTVTTTYYVTGTTNGLSDTDSITVVVTQLPVASFSANVSGDTVWVNGDSTGVLSCTWNWGDGTTYAGCSPAFHIYNDSGTYTIQLNVSATCGDDSVDHEVQIISLINGIDHYILQGAVKIFPVPALSVVHIILPDNETPLVVELYDISGRKYNRAPVFNQGILSVETSNLSPGIYSGKIYTDANIYVVRFVKY